MAPKIILIYTFQFFFGLEFQVFFFLLKLLKEFFARRFFNAIYHDTKLLFFEK